MSASADMKTGSLVEWLWPSAFMVAMGWFIWHLPAYILTFLPHESESQYTQVLRIHESKDVTPDLFHVFGLIDPIDLIALICIPVFAVLGIRTVKIAAMEFQDWRRIDRFSIFIGRVTMMLILAMTLVMLYEVLLRYAFEAPTKWANELTLWIAGFVFLCSGLYGMQQRSHIRIFLLYDMLPQNGRRICDTIWTSLVVVFVAGLIFGSYKQIFVVKFYRWEMFGTAFDPPIPATIQPMILIVLTLVALQAVANLINDWNAEPVVHGNEGEIDEDELEAIKRSLGDK